MTNEIRAQRIPPIAPTEPNARNFKRESSTIPESAKARPTDTIDKTELTREIKKQMNVMPISTVQEGALKNFSSRVANNRSDAVERVVRCLKKS